jgi:hypothetical protein
LASTPPGVRLFVDNKEISSPETAGAPNVVYLSRGRHTLRGERSGYKDWSQSLDLGLEDFSKDVQITLDPAFYALTILTTPASCQVLLDGQNRGYSDPQEGRLVLPEVSPGKHSVTIEHDGYENWTQDLSVESAQMIRAQLTAEQRQMSSDESEIIGIFQGWAASIERKDIDAHMRYYLDTLEKYYNLTYVSSSKVRDDRTRAFGKYQTLQVGLSNFNIQFDSSGQRVTALFDKNFDFRGERFYSGTVQNRMTLLRVGGEWRIIGEEELKIYNTSNGTN